MEFGNNLNKNKIVWKINSFYEISDIVYDKGMGNHCIVIQSYKIIKINMPDFNKI